MDVKAKFRLTVAVAASGLLALSGFWLQSEHLSLLAEKQEQAKNLVAIPYSIIAHQYALEKEGKISRDEAQRTAIEAIQAVRYDGDNYFWINDMHPTMVMHPIKSQLNGKDLTNYKDPAGKRLFLEMVKAVRRDGQGFVRYQWPRPGKENQGSVAKLSFVRGFEPWGWIIGTGIYIDDVDAVWRRNAATAAGLAVACLGTLLIVSAGISRSVFPRLASVVDRMKDITRGEGDFSGEIEVASDTSDIDRHDEISMLVAGFNEMLVQIKKRDAQLRGHGERLECQVAARTAQLQTANFELATAHTELGLFLECIPSILIGLDPAGHITRWNLAARQTFGINESDAIGRTLEDCGIKWLRPDLDKEISGWLRTESILLSDDLTYQKEGSVRFVGFSVRPIFSKQNERVGLIITGADVTEKKCLEAQLRQAQKLEAVGQLAAGIAHEINTPAQYVANNTTFFKESWSSINQLLGSCRALRKAADQGSASADSLAQFDRILDRCDLEYLQNEIPMAIDQSLEGLERITNIVKAMKEFSHPGSDKKVPIDVNQAIETTIAVAKNEWKYVADVITEFDTGLPPVPCLRGEFNQTILNLIANAAQAVAGVVGNGTARKGKITIITRRDGESVVIVVRDTGQGIPTEIKSRIFEPFFTTKAIGKGTGQGLSLAHATIVKRHQGQIWFESEVGRGTAFFIRLPIEATAHLTEQ